MKLLLISPKKVYATERLVAESVKLDIQITMMDASELAQSNYDIDPANFDALYIRQAYLDFDRTASVEHLQGIISLAQKFQTTGKVVIDQTIAQGNLGLGKYEALMQLQKQGIAIPRTRFLSDATGPHFDFPVIAKWKYGFGAKHTYLLKTSNDLKKMEQKYPPAEIMIQEFVPADWEYKIITAGYRSLPVIIKLKTNHNKFLPDLSQHQTLSPREAPEVVALAEQASQILQRELAKVDILQAGDQFYVLEVNRWPGLQYFETITKHNAAADFLQYIQGRI